MAWVKAEVERGRGERSLVTRQCFSHGVNHRARFPTTKGHPTEIDKGMKEIDELTLL